MAPGTEYARDFCAGIGPLQLGVVLVFCFLYSSCFELPQFFEFLKLLLKLRNLNEYTNRKDSMDIYLS